MEYLKRLLGIAEQEFEHIVADFHSAANKLEALVTRKYALAKSLEDEIVLKTNAKETSISDAIKAATTATKIRELIG